MQEFNVHSIDDESRLRHRRNTQAKLARELVRGEKRRDLKLILAQIDSNTDSAADAHSATCLPLQQELDAIDQERINDIVARRETSTTHANRQRELLAKLHQANISLEMTVEANRRAKQKIGQQIRDLEKEMTTPQVLENELCRFSSQELRDREFVLEQRLRFAVARKARAVEFAEKAADLLHSSERRNEAANIRHYSRRLREWRVELTDASEALASVQQEQEQLRVEMIQPEANELIEASGGGFF